MNMSFGERPVQRSEVRPISGEAAVVAHMLTMLSERARDIYNRLSDTRELVSDDEFEDLVRRFNALTTEDQLDQTMKENEILADRDIEPMTISLPGGGRTVVLTRERKDGRYTLEIPQVILSRAA
jgi:hypothetical protein